ncbi:plasminogen-like [Saccostrea echinata]|uniref:plasminogen-like n=1 Tax=Saccostrea echinata TaxID=191078 RepID=UPI002A7FD5D6|nr:plasminogen-like [Saccostrea echinata]
MGKHRRRRPEMLLASKLPYTNKGKCFEFGIPYRGSINTTISGKQCQRWDRQYPHQHNFYYWPGTDENFCRTLDEDLPWCYTTNSQLRYEFCYVHICGESVNDAGIDSFSHAVENYCRNFDREEPWCFTNDSSIRLELCDVEVCDTPCLNPSIYTQQRVLQHCINQVHIFQNCSQLWEFLTCLKQRIENITSAKCSDIPRKAIALEMQDVIEKTLGWKIDGCKW